MHFIFLSFSFSLFCVQWKQDPKRLRTVRINQRWTTFEARCTCCIAYLFEWLTIYQLAVRFSPWNCRHYYLPRALGIFYGYTTVAAPSLAPANPLWGTSQVATFAAICCSYSHSFRLRSQLSCRRRSKMKKITTTSTTSSTASTMREGERKKLITLIYVTIVYCIYAALAVTFTREMCLCVPEHRKIASNTVNEKKETIHENPYALAESSCQWWCNCQLRDGREPR